MAIVTAESPFAASPPGFWTRLDQRLERAGERLNPILVKEARQALKSRQFLITFLLLLVCGWCWSLIGVAVMGPRCTTRPAACSCWSATTSC